MILWCDGPHDPAENMRRDGAILLAADRARRFRPVLRLYRFEPHGITLGYAQRAERELDLERCARDRVRWAMRPTGGRAIFHAEEWTYSLTARIDDPRWGGSLRDAYAAISELVARSLRRLGAPVRLALDAARATEVARGDGPAAGVVPVARDAALTGARGPDPDGAGTPAAQDRAGPAPPCFVSTARHEIVLDGRKLAGSAQRRSSRALLQQGSVLLGTGHARLADYLALDEALRAAARARLAGSAADLGSVVGEQAPLERWADALERELGAGIERIDGLQALSRLTPFETGPYTPAPR